MIPRVFIEKISTLLNSRIEFNGDRVICRALNELEWLEMRLCTV
jgi:hypothetical protein